MAEFYVTEEKAMAPGIAGEWPAVIAKPDSPNGRLRKVDGLDQLLKDARDFIGTDRANEQAIDLFERLREVASS